MRATATASPSERSALVPSPSTSSPALTFSMDIELPPSQRSTSHRHRRRGRGVLGGRVPWGLVATLLWVGTAALYLLNRHRAGQPWAPFSSSSSSGAESQDPAAGPRFRIRLAPTVAPAGPITGRLLVCVAKKHAVADPLGADQPRLLVDDSADTQQVFGVDVWGFAPRDHGASDNEPATRELNVSHAVGYPLLSLTDMPADEYWVQAVLQPYVHYNRSDGQRLWLPGMDTFESDDGVLAAPGTLFSRPMLVQFDPRDPAWLQELVLDQVVGPLAPLAADTSEYDPHALLRHVRFRSPRLSAFWGTDVYLKAWVLLPHRFFEPETAAIRYPLFIYHTHYSREFEFDFLPEAPGANASSRELYGHYLYRNWTSDARDSAFYRRRGIIVQLQHANPYYDDSYAVNSANIGPYGDALTYEFIPYLEEQFRGLGEGWARTMYGGSTGGWESLAVQVFYPDEYNGCWSFCPDAFDFRKFQLVNLLEDDNAYYVRGDWTTKNRGAARDYLGHIRETMAQENHHELALGSRGRSGGQWDAWQAVYSPVNASDGLPLAIWDKLTGTINRETVAHWEKHFDVRAKLAREWEAAGLGTKLVNKLHVFVGVLDSYYLNDAVYYLEEFLESTQRPYYNGTIEYGVRDSKGYEHCWTGSYDESLSMAWNTLNQRILPQMIDHLVRSAPANASLGFTSY